MVKIEVVILTLNLISVTRKCLYYIPNTMIDSDPWGILFEILEAGNCFFVSESE